MWDLSSLSRDRTRTPCIGRRSLNHWTAREVPPIFLLISSLVLLSQKPTAKQIRITIKIAGSLGLWHGTQLTAGRTTQTEQRAEAEQGRCQSDAQFDFFPCPTWRHYKVKVSFSSQSSPSQSKTFFLYSLTHQSFTSVINDPLICPSSAATS